MAGTTMPTEEATIAAGEAVSHECVRAVCSLKLGDSIGALIGAFALAVVLLGEVGLATMVGWLLAVAISVAFRRVWSKGYINARYENRDRLRRRFLTSKAIEGTIWGVCPFLLQVRHQRYEAFVLCTLLAVSIVSSLALSPYPRAAFLFTSPINLGLATWMASQGGRWGLSGAAGVLLIYGMAIAYVRAAHLLLKNAIIGRLENADLAEQLELARARSEASNVELQTRNDQLSEIARRDPLTGLYNRRHFTEWLDRVRVTDVAARPWFLVILDADFFKRINDDYGHQAGDQVLLSIASAASAQLRRTDCLARIGGEEFGLLLQDITIEDAMTVVERVRSAVAAVDLGFGHITLSAGLVTGEQDMDAKLALSRADQAMYEAKRAGRNRLVCLPAVASAVPDRTVPAWVRDRVMTAVSTPTTARTEEEGSPRSKLAGADRAATLM